MTANSVVKLEVVAKTFGFHSINYNQGDADYAIAEVLLSHDMLMKLVDIAYDRIESDKLEESNPTYRTAIGKAKMLKLMCSKGINIEPEW